MSFCDTLYEERYFFCHMGNSVLTAAALQRICCVELYYKMEGTVKWVRGLLLLAAGLPG